MEEEEDAEKEEEDANEFTCEVATQPRDHAASDEPG